MKISPFSREEGSGSVEKVVTTFENHDLFLKANRAERKKAMGCQAECFWANIMAGIAGLFAHITFCAASEHKLQPCRGNFFINPLKSYLFPHQVRYTK